MSHTHTNLLFHIVFATHGHISLLKPEFRPELYAYIATLIKEKRGLPLIINGVEDHVHMLVALPPDLSLSDAMRFVKANSSRFFKRRTGNPFAWQKGFGAFSVSRSAVPSVSTYIREQEAHHQKFSFEDEYTSLLERHEVDFDRQYLWR